LKRSEEEIKEVDFFSSSSVAAKKGGEGEGGEGAFLTAIYKSFTHSGLFFFFSLVVVVISSSFVVAMVRACVCVCVCVRTKNKPLLYLNTEEYFRPSEKI
jgi:hypothetical protein